MSRNFDDEIREIGKLRQLIADCKPAVSSTAHADVEDVMKLFTLAQQNDEDARVALIGIYFPLLKRITMSYHLPGIDPADVLQEGMLGLTKAIERCDLDRIGAFAGYAEYWIRLCCGRFVYQHHQCIRQPVQVVLASRKVRRSEQDAAAMESDGANAGRQRKDAHIRRIASSYILPPVSLELLQEGDQQWEPQALDADDAIDRHRQELEERLYIALDALDPRSRTIITRLFGLDGPPQSLRSLAREFHLSAERIRQIKEHTLAALQVIMRQRALKGAG